jgi:SAM-dependent methyltransferase
VGFEAGWLAIRAPFDEAALDRQAVAIVKDWSTTAPAGRPLRLVDLGSGTGAALHRAQRWLAGRPLEAFAVDTDAALLAAGSATWQAASGIQPRSLGANDSAATTPSPYELHLAATALRITPLQVDLLAPLAPLGGPADGSLDLVLGHALADLLPIDRLAARAAALVRPGGLVHLALTYDGETRFWPVDDPALELRVLTAYHRQMDRPRQTLPCYGGSTAGRRLAPALRNAGPELLRAGPSCWEVQPDGPTPGDRVALLGGLLDFMADSLCQQREPDPTELARWSADRRARLAHGELGVWVRHLDLLARRPLVEARS